MSVIERLKNKIIKKKGCWLWIGYITNNGYGMIHYKRKTDYSHRVSYQIFKGKIPENKELDHLCRNRSCINPKHLEPVIRSENALRGLGPKKLGLLNSSKKKCQNGHFFNKKNTYYRKSGGRACRPCVAKSQQKYRQVMD